ncbi:MULTISPECIES: DUF4142 domain-containing protein [Paraburkholderia]|uniref:DUF4142 domain-containing protein n=1 Tax=Paraburkholderia acidicola TaxID=1912599 RepID=A0ABV1LYY6_9BURK
MRSRHVLKIAVVVLSVAIAPAGIAHAQGSDASASDASANIAQLSAADQQFVQDASTADATEIAASKVALKNAADPHVKKFAQQMIVDHTRLSHSMHALLEKKGISLTPSADSALVSKLQTLKGTAFDQAYIEQIALEGHQKAVDLFEKESQSGADPQLKAAAMHALPVIKHHLAMAQQLAGATKSS